METPGKNNKREVGGYTMPPETDTLKKRRNEAVERYAKEMQEFKQAHPERVALIESWIAEIDFEELRQIFLEYAVKSGIPPERLNFVPRKDIWILGSSATAVMSYSAATNSIRIYASDFLESNMLKDEPESMYQVIFLHSLCHEYGHATARVRDDPIEHTSTEKEEVSSISMQRGLSKDVVRIKTSVPDPAGTSTEEIDLFGLLYEGVNDRIGDEVFLEYLRRRPLSVRPEEVSSMKNAKTYLDYVAHDNTSDYGTARHFVTALVHALAAAASIPEDIVWRGLERANYRGDMLDQDETAALLDETFGSGFIDMLAQAKDTESLELLAMARLQQSLKDVGLAERWMRHLEFARGAK